MPHTAHFLYQKQTEPMKQKKRRTRFVRTIFLVLFLAFVFWLTGLVIASVYVVVHIENAKSDLFTAKDLAERLAFEDAFVSLQEAKQSFVFASRGLSMIRTIQWVPVMGHWVDLFADSIDSSQLFIEALIPLFELGSDLTRLSGLSAQELAQIQDGITPEITFDDLSSQTKEAILF